MSGTILITPEMETAGIAAKTEAQTASPPLDDAATVRLIYERMFEAQPGFDGGPKPTDPL